MYFRTSYILIAIFVVVGSGLTSAFATQISMQTDSDTYDHSSKIIVTGQIANIDYNYLVVTLKALAPNGNIAGVAQIDINNDGSFMGTFNTSGYSWNNNGTYQITATYGKNIATTISVEIVTTTETAVTSETETYQAGTAVTSETETTSVYNFPEGGLAYTITGGTLTSIYASSDGQCLETEIESTDNGVFTIALNEEIIMPFEDGTFFVLINGEEFSDFTQEGNKLTIPFHSETEGIDICGSWAIPEFGTIAVMILVVAIVSIIIVSAKTKLSLVPRY